MTSKTRLTLDLKDSQSFDTLILHRGDSKSRVIEIELTDNHAPVTLTSGMSATINASTNGIVVADGEKATVDTANNIISFTVTDNMTSLPGQSKISITVTEGESAITAQTFRAIVTDSVINEGSKFEPTGGTVKQFMDEVTAARGNYDNLSVALSSKANKATTYTKNEIDNLLIYDKLSVATAITVTMQSDSYCTKTGKVVSNTSFTCTEQITLADYSALSITSAYGYQAPLVVFFDDNDNLLSYELINESGVIKVTEQIINIPTSAATAIVNHANNTPPISVSGIKTEVVTIGQKLSDLITELSPLKGKTLYVDGDSIANGAGSGNYAFGEFLRDKYGMELTKGAVNGATLLVDDTHTNSICKRITQLTGEYDYIIFDGGINDVSQSLPLGSKTYHYNGGYDTTTTLGALEQICYYLVTNYFDSKKLFVIVHKILTVDNPVIPTKERDAFAEIKDVLIKWGIPFVDIYNDTNLGAFNSVINNAYFKLNSSGEGDRVHPTKEAYEKFYMPLIEAKIKTL